MYRAQLEKWSQEASSIRAENRTVKQDGGCTAAVADSPFWIAYALQKNQPMIESHVSVANLSDTKERRALSSASTTSSKVSISMSTPSDGKVLEDLNFNNLSHGLQEEKVLEDVKKTLEEMDEIVQNARDEGNKNQAFMDTAYWEKFQFMHDAYFTFFPSERTRKEQDSFRIRMAGLFIQQERFLRDTRAAIDYVYNNLYDEFGNLVEHEANLIRIPTGFLWNFTDAADEFTFSVCNTPGLIALLVKIAEEQYEKMVEYNSEEYTQLLSSSVTIIYNCSTRDQNRKFLRNIGAVKMLTPLLECKDEETQLSSLFALAFLCNEHESQIFQTNKTLIKYLLNRMQEAIPDKDRRSEGLSLTEMTRACGRLAINDENKQLLGEAGAIDILVEIASLDDADQEQVDATEALWTLSFEETNKQRIRGKKKAVTLLNYLAEYSDNKQTAKSAQGCLWTIRGKQQRTASAESRLVAGKMRREEKQIMISYQWKYQDLILKVRDRLRNMGYKIWIDLEKMEGSTLEAMAKAVEESHVVLMAMSQTYKDSSNTRSGWDMNSPLLCPNSNDEAEYAHTLDKKIIPLRVEANYRPDGWLGIIAGSKLYFDISRNETFDQKMNELDRELKKFLESRPEPALHKSSHVTLGRQASPVQASPVQPSSVQSSPVQAFPMQPSPVQSCPAQASPVQSYPVQPSPARSPPLQSSPVSTSCTRHEPAVANIESLKTKLDVVRFNNSSQLGDLKAEHIYCLSIMKAKAPKFYYNYVHRLITGGVSLDEMDDMATVDDLVNEATNLRETQRKPNEMKNSTTTAHAATEINQDQSVNQITS